MKIFMFLLIVIPVSLFAQNVTFEKIDDFAIAQSYWKVDSAIIEDDYLYLLSDYGLEIYKILTDGVLSFQSRLAIMLANSFFIKDDYAYVSTTAYDFFDLNSKIIQINLSDKQNPQIEQELELVSHPIQMNYYGNYLYFNVFLEYNSINYFYSLPDLNLVFENNDDIVLRDKLSDNLAVRGLNNNNFEIYDVADPFNFNLIGSGNISQIHTSGIHRVGMVNDSTLVFLNNSLLSFWDISNMYYWNCVSTYQPENAIFNWYLPSIIGQRMVVTEFGSVELLDISDLTQPLQLDLIEGTPGSTITISSAVYEDNIYLATNDNGILRLKMSNDIITFEEEIAEYYMHSWVEIKDNYLISGSNYQGCRYFDITNPADPIYIGQLLPPEYNYYFQIDHNLMAVQRIDNYDFVIFDAIDIENLTVRNIINFDNYVLQTFDETDDSAIYFVDQFNYRIYKYDISEPGNATLLFEVQLPFYPYWQGFFIKNGYGYFLQDTGNQKNLYIYSDLVNNNPILYNTIYDVAQYQIAFISTVENYLCLHSPLSTDNNTRFYHLQDPATPEFVFELDCFGKPFKHNDYIFGVSSFCCYIFEPGINPTGILEPVDYLTNISAIQNLNFVNYNNSEYLIMNEFSHFGVFEHNPLMSYPVMNHPVFSLSNHPNPFNPSTEIRFQMSEVGESESAEIVIYNIKGQKVKTLPVTPSPSLTVSLTWDGTDRNNRRVSSGVYFYQLQVDGKPLASRKMMMLK